MDKQFILIGVVILVTISVALLIWQRNRQNYNNRRKEMAERTDLYTDDYFDDDKSIPEPPIIDDIVELEEEKVEPSEQSIEEEPTKKSEILIVLYVVAHQQLNFVGEDILTILEKTGLKYGKMDIFHHYGIGEIKSRNPVFSVANIVAPGTLNPNEMTNFATPGLALFMKLPGPFGGRVAFELMLNHAERFAEALDGIVEDEQHTLINQQKITSLRERIANFEQRTVSLAMLKQFS
ncbi:MAG: cell division protein ZipA [Candidatus Marithrix sp.]